MKDISELEAERMEWALQTFPEATPFSSLNKLCSEIEEVAEHLESQNYDGLDIEYADCLMCLFDSAGRVGITPKEIFQAFERKLAINKERSWVKNPDNTYSHVKS